MHFSRQDGGGPGRLSILRLARRGGCGEMNAMSETIHYRPGKEPHPREHRMIFNNVDRVDWDTSHDRYVRDGGYEMLKKAVDDGAKAITDEVKECGLRGRGGAGFPTGVKWGFIPPTNTKPVYLICNADESEPGTFKDRYIIYQDPHQLIEGMAISCFAVNAKRRLHLHPRGVSGRRADSREGHRRSARRRTFSGKNICGIADSIWKSTSTAEPAPTFAAKRPGSSNRSRASARIRGSSRRIFRPRSGSTCARRS